ncbi:MAG: hypothetical protein QXM86_01545 [Candidatus Bathyarchaeia archaeon]
MEKERKISLNNVGIVLGILGGVMAVLESSIVLAYSLGRCGSVGLIVAILVLAGAMIAYMGFRLPGAMVMFFSTLFGQLTGGALGLTISIITSPPPSPIFNETFGVSGWTMLSLVGSILLLVSLKSRRE